MLQPLTIKQVYDRIGECALANDGYKLDIAIAMHDDDVPFPQNEDELYWIHNCTMTEFFRDHLQQASYYAGFEIPTNGEQLKRFKANIRKIAINLARNLYDATTGWKGLIYVRPLDVSIEDFQEVLFSASMQKRRRVYNTQTGEATWLVAGRYDEFISEHGADLKKAGLSHLVSGRRKNYKNWTAV